MSISKAPLEVVGHILGQLDSVYDLHSAVLSSSTFHNAFCVSRKRIFTSIIQTIVPPEVRRHAVAALKAPEIPTLPNSNTANLPMLMNFMDEYVNDEQSSAFSFPEDISNLIALAKLASRVGRLQQDYFLDAMCNLAESSRDPTLPQPEFSPSRTERARIQRAFFRFEIHCRCFAGSIGGGYTNDKSVVSAEKQSAFFLTRMSPWEVQEISEVHTYLVSRVESIISRMQGETMSIILEHEVDKESYEPESLCNYLYVEKSFFFYPGEMEDLNKAISLFVSKGVGHLGRVFDARGEAQRGIFFSIQVNRDCSSLCYSRDYLPNAIQFLKDLARVLGDDSASRWHYGADSMAGSDESSLGRDHSALPTPGNVFWDTARFVRQCETYADIEISEPKGPKEIDLKPAQEKFEHTQFPKACRLEILRLYGLKWRWISRW